MGTQKMDGFTNEDMNTHSNLGIDQQNIQIGNLALLNLQRVKPKK